MARAMLIDSHTPRKFWPEAIATSVYLVNRLPTSTLNLHTPLKTLSAHTQIPLPLTLQPRVFGCSVFVHIPKHERDKLSACAVKCVFVGYGVDQKGYRCYDPKSNRVVTTMNCDFLESEYFFNHLGGQGESDTIDQPSRFSMPSQSEEGSSMPSPPEVIRIAEQINNVQQTGTPSDIAHDPPLLIPTVSSPEPETVTNTDNSEIDTEAQTEPEICDLIEEHVNEEFGRYMLPHLSTRGVPPKKYSPERIRGAKARYSIANIAMRHISKMAKAFEAALYEEVEIPCTVEEAWGHKHWREAMLKEMGALERNDT